MARLGRAQPFLPKLPKLLAAAATTNAPAEVATSTATANNAAASIAPAAGLAQATATANAAALSIKTTGGLGSVSATANGGAGSVAVGPTAGSATATAYDATISTSSATNASAGSGSVTVTGYDAGKTVAPNGGAGSVTATGNNAASSLASSAGSGSVGATASGGAGSVAVGPTAASASAAAYNATVQTGTFTNAAAGAASVTATANNATTSIKTTAGNASVAATANNATVSTSANTNATAGAGSATATAYDATISVKTSAGVGTITVTAYSPSADNGEGAETLGRLVRVHRPRVVSIPVIVGYVNYLDASVGTATTPDPNTVMDNCTWVFKVRGPTSASPITQTIASQWTATGNQKGFILRRVATSGRIHCPTSADGSTDGPVATTPNISITGADEYLAYTRDTTNDQTKGWTSTDGASWTSLGFLPYALDTVFNTSTPLCIGAYDPSIFEPWTGRIYYVELRTGLDPAAGTVLWRFDANDYPGTGTSYTDPRGTTWTLSSAAAIVRTQGDRYVYPRVRISI